MSALKKLAEIQAELKCGKSQYNSFGNYAYRSCEDILEAVKPLAHLRDCAILLSDKPLMVGDRYYIEATAQLIDCESGEIISNTASAREEESKKGMDGSQITGTASSYARKYALNGLFCIDDTKDADTDSYGIQTGKGRAEDLKPKQTKELVGDLELEELDMLIAAKGADTNGMCKYFKKRCLEEFTLTDYHKAVEMLKKKADVA